MRFSTFVFLAACCLVQFCSSARIVVVYTVCTKSHVDAVMPIVEELARRGHQITVISAYEGVSKSVERGRSVVLHKTAKQLASSLNTTDLFAAQKRGLVQIFSVLGAMKEVSLIAAEEIFTHPEFLDIVRKRDVDLFLVDGLFQEFLYPVFDQMGVPFVTHISSSAFPSTLSAMGVSLDYASVPAIMTPFDSKMTITQRILNLAMGEVFSFVTDVYVKRDLNAVIQSHFPGARTIFETEGEASILLLNNHPMTNWQNSLPPTIVSVAALHARPAKPLSDNFKTFADGAKEGLIIFTLGSMVPISTMPKETLDCFIRVFSKMPQRTIMKWEAEIPHNLPSNIMMAKWLPQQDLLGHPNAKVFITHGGLLGVQEAAYHGVPILGFPFGNDQSSNIAKMINVGWGLKLDWNTVDDRLLTDALTTLITDPTFQANASRVSRIVRDQVIPGIEEAVYWIEYVLRHGDTKHLQTSYKHMPFYQRNLIDVALVLILAFIFCLFIFVSVIRMLFSKCFSAKKLKAN